MRGLEAGAGIENLDVARREVAEERLRRGACELAVAAVDAFEMTEHQREFLQMQRAEFSIQAVKGMGDSVREVLG